MLKVKVFEASSTDFAESTINKFLASHQDDEIADIKMTGDGHSICVTYMIIYKANA